MTVWVWRIGKTSEWLGEWGYRNDCWGRVENGEDQGGRR